ncbi:MAG: glycosyltransferase family 39 protein [Chloroflexi bacterium]|nr:glycosyltransferase family 39 protein [Chloroflexota bacterium]
MSGAPSALDAAQGQGPGTWNNALWKWGVLVAVVLLGAVSVYSWASLDQMEVTVAVSGEQLVGEINGKRVLAADGRFPSGGVALRMGDYRSYKYYSNPFPFQAPVWEKRLLGPRLIPVARALEANNGPPAWQYVEVSELADTGVLLRDSFTSTSVKEWKTNGGQWHLTLLGEYRTATRGEIATGSDQWSDYQVKVRIQRPRGDLGIVVRYREGSGYLFWFRPEHGDMGWQVLGAGGPSQSLSGGEYRPALGQALKGVLRELLWPFLLGALLLLEVLLAAALLAIPLSYLKRLFSRLRIKAPGAPRLPAAASLALAVGAIVLAAITINALVASLLLDGIPHVQDSVAYLFQAKTLARGALWAPAPPLPEFFTQEFIVNYGEKWFSKYPPGHALMLAIGVLAGHPWLTGPILGGLSLGLVTLLGREVWGLKVGVLAALLGLLSPFFIFLSASYMAHPSALFWGTAFMLTFAKAMKSERPWWAFASGFSAGFLLITRELTAVAVLSPFIIYAAAKLLRSPWGFRAALAMAGGAAIPLGFLLLYNGLLTGNPFHSPFNLWWFFDRPGFGETVGGRGGHTAARGLLNTWWNLSSLNLHLFGWPMGIGLALASIPFLTWQSTKWDWLLLATFLSLMAAHVFYWADGVMYGPRYYFEALPALLLLTARGILILARLPGEVFSAAAPKVQSLIGGARTGGAVLMVILVLLLVYYNLVHYMPGQIKTYQGFNMMDAKAARVIKGSGIRNALVFAEHEPIWYWWQYGSVFILNSPFLDGDVVVARDRGDTENARLMKAFPTREYYRFQGGRLYSLSPTQTP